MRTKPFTISDIRDGFKKAEFTVQEIINHYLKKIEANKNLNAFISVFSDPPILNAQYLIPDAPLAGMVVGDGPLRPALEAEARHLGLNGRVRFTGWRRDLAAVYEGLEATCVTSWNEGTPVALIEAMAAGHAVVATDVGGVGDLLRDQGGTRAPIPAGGFERTGRGLLVRPGDPEGLAEALATVARDPDLRRSLGRAARDYVIQRFGAERLVGDLAQLYGTLMEGEPA